MQIDKIIKSLQSGDLERQDAAFREITDFMTVLGGEMVNAMRNSSRPTVVAENIFKVAYAIQAPLEALFTSTASHELKSLSGCLLIQMGSRIGLEYLLHTIRTGADYDTVSATSLAKTAVQEAIPALIERLERFEPTFYTKRENVPMVNTFLIALEILGGKLPAHLRVRFTAPDVPADLSRFIK